SAARARLSKEALWPPGTWREPPEEEERMPPVRAAPLTKRTAELAPVAVIVPPALLKEPPELPLRTRMPPPEARRRPWLVNPVGVLAGSRPRLRAGLLASKTPEGWLMM